MGRKQVWKVLLGSRMATALREVVGHRVLVPGSLVPPAKLFARDHKALARAILDLEQGQWGHVDTAPDDRIQLTFPLYP